MDKEKLGLEEENQLNLIVTFRRTQATDSLKKYAIDKISQRVQKYVRSAAEVHIILSVEKLDHIAEVNLKAAGYDCTASAVTGDLYAAIDKLVDILETQLRKQKDKNVTQRSKVESV